MTRIPAVDPASATGKAGDLLQAVKKKLGVVPNLFRVAAHAPAALEGLLGLSGSLAGGTLSPRTREAVALAVAETNACDYCLSAHTYLGRAAGLSGTDVEAARRGEATDPRLAATLAFAGRLVETRGRVTAADVVAARAAGLDDAALVEVVGHVALNIFTNYLNHVADTEIDFPVVRTGTAAAA
ncbi:carboxymuconolactone decarboxylase family protein [Oharaeibacter diazotrophicus]|uniref:Putative peroxidase-related enzyme n=1 Tax=Oharaeibacter diazotrophicus TaxID=1920512 RepID=A0A4R6RKS5_9HYPH|nr:carboxymuconolactone decarboxylase family protein [Oharaeibacter diazotrophicus]TDP87261.1 putative peroxidase-related enzyme [Oharaeibacter diazotrophicus]BBE70795.1 carboxymuconolactone decarboxylase family protein [Pleomorphomonas sp. SM30]GLS77544.1 alkyl hydroperoxide reductase AhpD [Oharaeibacter diazotrophicus]